MSIDPQDYFEEISEVMPHFLFYRKARKKADIYCTACHDRFEITNKDQIKDLKHKSYKKCPHCQGEVECRQMDRGRAAYHYYDNFAIFRRNGNGVEISCITVYQSFEEDIMEPVYDWHETTRYELTKGSSAEYRKAFCSSTQKYEWTKMKKKPKEPIFHNSGFGSGYNGYHVLGRDEIQNSFLGYLFKGADESELPHLFITYYCRYAEHPQLEYLIHGGLRLLADAYIEGTVNLTRINWRSNDLKKMLRLNKEELDFLKDNDGREYNQYICFRREVYCGRTPSETIRYYKEFGYNTSKIIYISRKTNISAKRIMDYVLKHRNKERNTFMLYMWSDYLRECEELEYDLHDESIVMPRDLAAAHERTASIIKTEHDMRMKIQMELSNEARKKMVYTDQSRGLTVIIPDTIEEIAREGRILHHCVGGYAKRHAEGALHILFIRQIGKEDIPYYTMEVDLFGKIVQCRGFKNNIEHNGGSPKPQEIKDFEEEYQKYLDSLFRSMTKSERKGMKQAV